LLRLALAVGEVPDEGAEEVDEAFEDADDDEAHQDPFRDLCEEGAFDDSAEAEAEDGDDRRCEQRDGYRRPFDECLLVNCLHG
jgi:hypothetical protein